MNPLKVQLFGVRSWKKEGRRRARASSAKRRYEKPNPNPFLHVFGFNKTLNVV